MISIDELELENFQTHKKTKIKLSPNFNVIVGCTRSGKSSVVRALDFLFYNNWYEDYQRFDTPYAVVTATLSNGKVIKRTKSDRINKIDITTGENVDRFESFGFTLPTEATAALGIIPVEITSKDAILANVANQDDPLFLLYSTGTDRTKILSRLSGLHWLDYALKDLSKDRRTKSAEVQTLTESNEQLLLKLKNFKDLQGLKKDLAVVREKVAQLKKIEEFLRVAEALLARTRTWKSNYEAFQKLKTTNFSQEIPALERVIVLREILDKLQNADSSLSNIKKTAATMHTHILTLATSIKEVETEIGKVPTCPACGQEAAKETTT